MKQTRGERKEEDTRAENEESRQMKKPKGLTRGAGKGSSGGDSSASTRHYVATGTNLYKRETETQPA